MASNKKLHRAVIFLCAISIFSGCTGKRETLISGQTMGTTYHIKVVAGYFKSLGGLKKKIAQRLEVINQSMSLYIPHSEINRFNALEATQQRIDPSADFRNVMRMARKIYLLTDGAWDGTVKPLVDLWGFGTRKRNDRIPTPAEIRSLLNDIGFSHIGMVDNGYFFKRKKEVTLDLGSIAKGYAVDQVVALIRRNRIRDFMVEIGGETYAAGHRSDGQSWRVGINKPVKNAALNAIYKVIHLKNKALATSGDYRNFFEINGKRYSHILDPRTGYPVSNGVVSVSIVSDSCTFADGLATAVMVMGPQKGIQLLNRLDHVTGLIVVKGPDGKLKEYASKGFKSPYG